ncbi:MFS general substrate transporter [Sarocladium strictum]
MSTLPVLFVGVLLANIDTMFLIACYPQISSELHAFESGAWLLTSYMLAMCATQPLYGKLSNIFGRKKLVITTYLLYSLGSAICALAPKINILILGRAIAGTGGAGMVCLVSIIITDIVPLQDVALYRSYVNVIQTVGRSIGAPIGGLVVERFGWRAAFASVAPLSAAGALLVALRLQLKSPHAEEEEILPSTEGDSVDAKEKPSSWALLKRVDFLGSFWLSLSIVLLLLIFSFGGDKIAWTDYRLFLLVGGTLVSGAIFYITERFVAAEPMFPPSILGIRAVVASYGLLFAQNAAQSIATVSVPLFYQLLLSVGPSVGGVYLLSSVVGNTIGGLATGYYVKRTGKYRLPCIVSAASAATAYGLMFRRWRPDSPSFHPTLENIYVFGGGLGTGMAHSSGFVVLTAGISAYILGRGGSGKDLHDNIAIAGSGIYLSGSIGATVGMSLSNALLRGVTTYSLANSGLPGSELESVIKKALESIEWIEHLEPGTRLREIVMAAYMTGLRSTFLSAALTSLFGLVMALVVVEHPLG